jgi:1-aminocyclopropane-1-carboxylate deaminase
MLLHSSDKLIPKKMMPLLKKSAKQSTKQLFTQTPSPEQVITPSWLNLHNIQISIKRDDLLHPIISGNKWRKLKYALSQASDNNITHIVSFGGGYSNHLHALGYCCQQLGIHLSAIVRGDYSQNLSPMLQDLLDWGVDIQYVDRITYQQRADPEYLQALSIKYPDALLIPEGGSQQQALKGVAEIIQELTHHYDYILAPVASGGTLAGLIDGVAQQKNMTTCQILGIAVLKGQDYLEQLVDTLLTGRQHQVDWHINHDYQFGGYAKSNSELNHFCTDFKQQTHIPIEPVYSGKLFYALHKLTINGRFPSGSRVLALHTGGLQGAR